MSLTAEQEQLVEENLELARNLAWKYARLIRFAVDPEDLTGVANEELVSFALRWTPNLQTGTFRTAVVKRIWWAFIEAARANDPNSRRARIAFARGEKATQGGREIQPIKLCELRDDLYGSRDLAESVCAWLDAVAALSTLSHRQALIVLRGAAGYSGKETATELGLCENMVSRIRAAATRDLAELVAA